jgi:membrane protease YdiL (CAAX protease family)
MGSSANCDGPTKEESSPVSSIPPQVSLPGPGLFASLGWMVLFQILAILFAVGGVAAGPVIKLTFFVGGNLVAAFVIVLWQYGSEARRKLALCGMSRLHFICTILLVPPVLVLVLAFGEGIQSAYIYLGWAIPQPAKPVGNFVNAVKEMGLGGAVAVVLIAGMLPALGEEVFFRGFIGRGLVARWGPVLGVLLTSLLFGAIHFHPITSLTAVLGGLTGHLLYLWSRSLLAPMIRHVLHNSTALLLATLAGGIDGPQAALTLIAAGAVVMIGVLLYRTQASWVFSDGGTWSPGYNTAEMPPTGSAACLRRRSSGTSLSVSVAAIYVVFCALVILHWFQIPRPDSGEM